MNIKLHSNYNIQLSKCLAPVCATNLEFYVTTPDNMAQEFSAPVIGSKDGSYFLRCSGTQRNNAETSLTASILILDGDSSINEDGEIMPGAPNPELVHHCLVKNEIPHFIYSSYSNGEDGDDYYKYRVIIFIEYDREQLPVLLDYIHKLLHDNNVLLVNVRENRAWAQAWYFPRCPEDKQHLFRFYKNLNGSLDVVAICTAHAPIKPEPNQSPPRLAKPFKELQIDPIRLFNEHCKSPVNYLMTQGYRYKSGQRLLPPYAKETSVAGVQICHNCTDGIERIYSHHGNDPLSDGFSHDSFDCFKILEHGGDINKALKAVGQTFSINGITLEKHNQVHYAKGNTSCPIDWSAL